MTKPIRCAACSRPTADRSKIFGYRHGPLSITVEFETDGNRPICPACAARMIKRLAEMIDDDEEKSNGR